MKGLFSLALFLLMNISCNFFAREKDTNVIVQATVKRLEVDHFTFNPIDSSIDFTLTNNPFYDGITLGGEILISTRKYDTIGSLHIYYPKDVWSISANHLIKIPLLKNNEFRIEGDSSSISNASGLVKDAFIEGDSIDYITLRLWSNNVIVMDSSECNKLSPLDLGYCRWRNGKKLLETVTTICVIKSVASQAVYDNKK